MWSLAQKNIKEIWRDKKLLVISLLFPVLLLFVSHFIARHAIFYTANLPLAVVNPETTFPKAGKLLVMALERAITSRTEEPLYAVQELGAEDALRHLEEGKVVGVLLIPPKFTEKLQSKKKEKLVLILDENDARAGVLAGSLSAFIEHFGHLILKSRHTEVDKENPVFLSTIPQGKGILPPEGQSLANVALFAFLFLVPFAAGQMVSEIERGSLTRLRLAEVSSAKLFSGLFLSTAFLGFLQTALLLSSAYLLGLRPYLFMLWMWPLTLLFVLASGGLGLLVSTFVEKEKQLNLFASLLLIGLYLFSSSMGHEILRAGWIGLLPWNQGYSMMSQLLNFDPPRLAPALKMLLSSLVLVILGTVLFSRKRLRA